MVTEIKRLNSKLNRGEKKFSELEDMRKITENITNINQILEIRTRIEFETWRTDGKIAYMSCKNSRK